MAKWTNEELGKAIADAVFSTTIAKSRTFELKMADFPINAIIAMLSHGAQRKFNDAVGGADKTAETKVELAEKMIADYKEGIVSKRREGTTVDLRTKVARKLMRALVPSLLDAASLKKFRDMSPEEQAARLDAWCEANEEALAPQIDAEIKRMEDEAKKKAKLSSAINVSL